MMEQAPRDPVPRHAVRSRKRVGTDRLLMVTKPEQPTRLRPPRATMPKQLSRELPLRGLKRRLRASIARPPALVPRELDRAPRQQVHRPMLLATAPRRRVLRQKRQEIIRAPRVQQQTHQDVPPTPPETTHVLPLTALTPTVLQARHLLRMLLRLDMDLMQVIPTLSPLAPTLEPHKQTKSPWEIAR